MTAVEWLEENIMGNQTTTTTQNLEYLNYIYMMSQNK